MSSAHHAGRTLKLRDLNILLAVADAGSMAKAAVRLSISQPAVSRAIADMERALGVTLLDRSPQGVEPTQYGHALLRRGVAVFDELKQGIEDITFLSKPEAGELRIGSSSALAEGIVLAAIDRLSQLYPRVVFHVAPDDANALYDQLRERRVELGIARMSGPLPGDDITTEMLFDEDMVVVAGEHSPWARRRRIRLAELRDERWTWPPPGTMFDAIVGEAFRASNLDPPRAAVYTHAINMRIGLAATGHFLAIVPAAIMRFPTRHPSVRVLPVALPRTRRQIGILTLKRRTLSPLAQRFIACLREIARPLATRRPIRRSAL